MTHASSKYADKSTVATTDNDGYYSFNFKAKRNRYYNVSCIGDSDYVAEARVEISKVNHIDLRLGQ